MITVEMVRDKGFDVAEGDNVWRDIANEFIPLSNIEARWIKERIISSCSVVNGFAWRNNKGEMPCDGELWVEVEFRDGEKFISIASGLCWVIRNNSKGDIIKWRPSFKNWESEMNLDKIETQEEKEAFEGMANSSEVPNSSEWFDNGDLPPKGVKVECSYTYEGAGDWCDFHGPSEVIASTESMVWVAHYGEHHRLHNLNEIEFKPWVEPETPEQKAEREREEWAQNVIGELMDSTGLDFTNDGDIQVVKAMYDLNYRKQNG